MFPQEAPARRGVAPRFDFQARRWNVRHRAIKAQLAGLRRLGGSSPAPASSARCSAAAQQYRGQSPPFARRRLSRLRGAALFRSGHGQLRAIWVARRRAHSLCSTVPVIGSSGRCWAATRDDLLGGRSIRLRFLARGQTASRAEEQALSPDGRANWETNWAMDFTGWLIWLRPSGIISRNGRTCIIPALRAIFPHSPRGGGATKRWSIAPLWRTRPAPPQPGADGRRFRFSAVTSGRQLRLVREAGGDPPLSGSPDDIGYLSPRGDSRGVMSHRHARPSARAGPDRPASRSCPNIGAKACLIRLRFRATTAAGAGALVRAWSRSVTARSGGDTYPRPLPGGCRRAAPWGEAPDKALCGGRAMASGVVRNIGGQ